LEEALGRAGDAKCVDNFQHIANLVAKGDRHPDKDIRKAVAQAEAAGWTVDPGKNHTWGVLKCGQGCKLAIWCTPRNPTTIAKRIREHVAKCPHDLTEDDET
jgi:hypothetical protein